MNGLPDCWLLSNLSVYEVVIAIMEGFFVVIWWL